MRCAMRGLIPALVAISLGCAQISVAGSPEPKKPQTFLSISNLDTQSPDAEYRVGHTIRVLLTKVKKKDELSVCHRITRPTQPDLPEIDCSQEVLNGIYHRNGLWSFDFKIKPGQEGEWETWIMVNRFETNSVSFRVLP